MFEELATLLDMVPLAWWAVAGKVFTWAMLAMMAVYALIHALERIDMLDGKRDLPEWIFDLRDLVTTLLCWLAALLEMLPVRMPIVDGWRRMRELARAQNPADGGDES